MGAVATLEIYVGLQTLSKNSQTMENVQQNHKGHANSPFLL
jgi:hypothetical protein